MTPTEPTVDSVVKAGNHNHRIRGQEMTSGNLSALSIWHATVSSSAEESAIYAIYANTILPAGITLDRFRYLLLESYWAAQFWPDATRWGYLSAKASSNNHHRKSRTVMHSQIELAELQTKKNFSAQNSLIVSLPPATESDCEDIETGRQSKGSA